MKILPWGIAACLSVSTPLYAAVTTISGGISSGYEYFDRQYKTSNSSDDDYSRFTVSPFVTVLSETERQSLTFNYAPTLWYDFHQNEDDINHALTLDYLSKPTQYWSVSLADHLSISDEFNSYSPTTDPETGDITSGSPGQDTAGNTLRDQRGRRRYTDNSFSVGTAYSYYEDSSVALDYVWSILRNQSDYAGEDYQDYDKHDVGLTVVHKFNTRWNGTAGVGYVRGLYDSVGNSSPSADTDDVDEYRADMLLNYRLTPLHTLSGAYNYNQSNYDSSQRTDIEIHNVTFGWVWDVSSRLNISMGAGPTYTKPDNGSGDWSSNENFGLRYRLEKGSVELLASHGTRFDNFDGTDQRSDNEYWDLQATYQHSFTEYIGLSSYVSFTNEDRTEITVSGPPGSDTVNSKTYAAGVNLDYRFFKNYTAGLSYGFVRYVSDVDADEYDDNRIALTISYENDFFRW